VCGLVLAAPSAHGQALPTASRAIPTFSLPDVSGTLSFGISASESITSGYYTTGTNDATGLSADVAYLSPSRRYPFSMVFSGGKSWSNNGGASPIFLNLAMSQVFGTKSWQFVVTDGVNYLPQTATTGLSGIPGTGDLGISAPVVGSDTGQGVLTGNSARVSNTVSLGVSHRLTGKTSVNASGSYSSLYFLGNDPNDQGIGDTSESGSVGLSHALDARTSIGASYGYGRFSYGTGLPGFQSQTVSGNISHRFSRRLTASIGAGPQFSSSYNNPQPTPTSHSLYVSASAGYTADFANFSLSYSRGTNAGSGVLLGANSDSVSLSAGRTFARVWNASIFSAYTRTTSLSITGAPPFKAETLVEGVQAGRAVGRHLSAYASYTLENQGTSGTAGSTDLFSGLIKTAAFGLTYSPGSIHLGSN
jgi:hypothetical protein